MYSATGIGPATAMSWRISRSSGEASSAIGRLVARLRLGPQRISKYADSRQHQWNAEQHSHGQSAPEKAQLRIGLAEKLARDTRQAVADGEAAGDDARPLERAETDQNIEHNKQHDAFERRFIKLAGMARNRAPGGKDHGPWHVGRPAPQFTVDEIGEAAEEQPDRGHGGRQIAKREDRDFALQGERDDRDGAAEKSAVKRHAAVPELKNLQRMLGEQRQVVEQHVTDAAAENDAERDPDDEIVEIGHRQWGRAIPQSRRRDEGSRINPAGQNAD